MKTIVTLFFCTVVLVQGADRSEADMPLSATQAAPETPRGTSFPIPEPSTVLLSILAGALGVLRRTRT